MWIFTNKGMVSCVKHTDKPDTMLIRARTESHLLHFVGRELESRYFTLQIADYKHRAELSVSEFMNRLVTLAGEIEYPDFKGSIKAAEDQAYKRACHDVWGVMNCFAFGSYDTAPTATKEWDLDVVDPEGYRQTKSRKESK